MNQQDITVGAIVRFTSKRHDYLRGKVHRVAAIRDTDGIFTVYCAAFKERGPRRGDPAPQDPFQHGTLTLCGAEEIEPCACPVYPPRKGWLL